MAPAVRVSSSPAPRCLRSPPRSAGRPGRGGKGGHWQLPPALAPLSLGPGGLPSAHLLPGAAAAQGGGGGVCVCVCLVFRSPSSLPPRRGGGGRRGKNFSGFVAGFRWEKLVRNTGERGGELAPSRAGSPLLWGGGERGYNARAELASGGGRRPADPNSGEVH